MSFKIFSLQLLGKIKPVETIEAQRKQLLDDYNEFEQIEHSDELKKFLELETFIGSQEFKKKKAEIEALQFKGSKEFNQLAELEKLKKASTIKNYFKVAGSNDLKRFEGLKKSDKLNEYDNLLEYIKEGQFEKDKSDIKKQVFKGSVEEKHWNDFQKLDKSAAIKAYKELHESAELKKHKIFSESEKLKEFVQLLNLPDKDKQKNKELKSLQRDHEIKSYFKFEKSKKLKLYHEIAGSHDLKRYYELKEFVEKDEFKKRESFLKDNKKFEKSEAFKKYSRFKQLVADADVKFLLKFEKSRLYKNYLNVVDSFDLKRYHELVEIVSSEEFKQRKIYLEDKKKWEKTEEFAQLQEFTAMKKLPHLVKYFKYKGTTVFDFFRNWEVAFSDNFSEAKIDTGKWSFISASADKMVGDNFALAGDLHVFTQGNNIKTGKRLTIEVRKEKASGKVWKMPAGFVPAEFDYTSGLISTWNSFEMEDGIIEAKIKFNQVRQVVSSFYLAGSQDLPRINLVEMGVKNRVGVLTLNSNKAHVEGLDISNLKNGLWYIFGIEKKGSNYTWKINGTEVFSLSYSSVKDKLHLNASSLVVEEISASQLPSAFEIEWVKCWRKK